MILKEEKPTNQSHFQTVVKFDKFVKYIRRDMKELSFSEEDINGSKIVCFKLGVLKMEHKIQEDCEYETKKLFEEFISLATKYYTDRAWGL